MRHTLALLALLLMFAAPVAAQTHPCDVAQPTSGTAVAGASVTIATCSDGKDANGNVTPITGWAVYDNGTRTTPTLTAAGAPSPVSGLTLYSAPMTAPATASVHTYQVAAINAQGEGAKSGPFVLTVNLPLTVPSAPVKTRIQ